MAQPKYPSVEGSERELYDRHLDFARSEMIRKVEGLSDELGAKRLGKTMTSVLGILKHMVDVEAAWFQMMMMGQEVEYTSSPEDPDGDFRVEAGETAEVLLGRYRAVCEKSREICAGLGLDDESAKARRDGSRPTLRWVYLHMIDETARHNGHLDIYRELLDGAVDAGD